MLGTFGSVCGD